MMAPSVSSSCTTANNVVMLVLLLIGSACGLVPTSVLAHRRAVGPVMLSGYRQKPLPEGLVAWGADEALWRKVTNKKGLLDLLKKGEEERGPPRTRRRRKVYT